MFYARKALTQGVDAPLAPEPPIVPPISRIQNSILDEMARGEYYKPLDSQLVELRKRAEGACERFNEFASKGMSKDEMSRCLHSIIEYDPNKPDGVMSNPGQWIGNEVKVQAPFYADYGFNLRIGDDVCIKANCRFEDPRMIIIGNGTTIGPNVTISGELVPRAGRHWRRGVTIRIGRNVYIGANCVIAPRDLSPTGLEHPDQSEIVIGDDAYIAPGTVVCEVNTLIISMIIPA
jgi:hypothetical protein